MGYSEKMGLMVMLMVVLMGILMVEEITAQIPDCASKLVPCAYYLNSTKPPESCCQPLRDAVKNQRKCLCDLYDDPALLQSFGINVTQALELPKFCGVSSDTSACNKAPAQSPTGSPSPPGSQSPPGVPGDNSDNGGATKMAWIGCSGLLLFWASFMAY